MTERTEAESAEKVAEISKQAEKERKAADRSKTVETWISTSAKKHSILVKVGHDTRMVQFNDWGYTCDMKSEEGKAISKGLHECGREGRDIFVLGPPYAEHEIGKRAQLLRKLRDMDVVQLLGLITAEEMMNANLPVNATEKEELIMVIMRNKSLALAG